MDRVITKIDNLTKKTTFEDAAEVAKFTISASGDKASNGPALDIAKNVDFATEKDNIQVTWTEGTTEHRSLGGVYVLTGTSATISGLVDVSQFSVGVTGELEIGKDTSIAKLNISIGNLNAHREWIIDFSNQRDGATGSEINLQALIDWIRTKNKDLPVTDDLPPVSKSDGTVAPVKDFIIQFKQFYFNIDRKTFDFWVQSKEGGNLKFGEFELKSVGFRVTNVPTTVAPEVKVVDKTKTE